MNMIASVRDSKPIRALGLGLTIWAALFALLTLLAGREVTTPQWLYLFSIPGGYYSWAALFGAAATLSGVGLVRRKYRLAAVGQFIMGTGCSAVALLYIFAPMFGNELVTLGFSPWLLNAFFMYFLTATNWSTRAGW